MRLVLTFLVHPRAAAKELKKRPRWLAAFLCLAAVSIIVYVLMYPQMIRLTLSHLPPTATPEEQQVVAESLGANLIVRCMFMPVRLFIGWSAFALLVFYVCKSFNPVEAIRFSQMFSLTVHVESILVLGNIAAYIFSSLQPDHFITSGHSIPFGLAMLLGDSSDAVLHAALNTLNIFTVWYVIALGMGVSTVCGFRFPKGMSISLVVSAVVAGFNIGTMKLLRETLHLLV